MKKIIKYITEYTRPLLPVLLMLIIAGDLSGQDNNAVGMQANSAVYVKACGNYPASGTLVHGASTLTAGKECNTTITESSATVYFTARDSIILSPGFKALNGSKFIARIEPYSGATQTDVSKASGIENENITQNVTVYPNPFTRNFIAMVSAKKAGKVQVTIYNSSGSKINEQAGVNLVKGINEINFNGANFASGVYTLEINFGDSKIVKKIFKGD
jgi:hypothetical protein